jgi:diacylglycerol kinase family enzyme
VTRRLLLVSNANAQNVTPYRREVIAKALSSEFSVEQVQTAHPGHAVDLARAAAEAGVELVVALGGDGTVNEVANGLAGTQATLGILPGGLANVFARSLGIPEDPVEAAGLLLQRVEAKVAPHRVPLGRIDGRYFVTNCGIGFDASIVREVERRQKAKKRGGDLFFVWTGARMFFTGYDRRRPKVHLSWGVDDSERRDGLFMAIFQNTSPYTYLGKRPMLLCPDARLDGAIDCFALDSMKARTVVPLVLSSFRSGRRVRRSKHVLSLRDHPGYTVTCDEPMPVQTDGELIGERDALVVELARDALSVLS